MLYKEEVFRIPGAIVEVHRQMGAGFLEAVYQECLAMEFASRGVPFVAAPKLTLAYTGATLRQHCVPDIVCFERVVIEPGRLPNWRRSMAPRFSIISKPEAIGSACPSILDARERRAASGSSCRPSVWSVWSVVQFFFAASMKPANLSKR